MRKTTMIASFLACALYGVWLSEVHASDGLSLKVQTVSEFVKPRQRPAGGPKASDVCFSTRSVHPVSAKDPHDPIEAARAFHASFIAWVYTHDAQFISTMKKTGRRFQVALNTNLDGRPWGYTPQQGRQRDKAGNLLLAPWMRSMKDTWWGCVNSPIFRRIYLETARQALGAGADEFQMDDPGQNYDAMAWGACYCENCRRQFAKYHRRNPNAGYADFQKESVTRFYAEMRAEIDRYARRHVVMSSNNYNAAWDFPHGLFDYGMGEMPSPSAEKMVASMEECARLGRTQVHTLVSRDVSLTRRTIAMAYATGQQVIVPWDVYMGSMAEPRYFAEPGDYADLYGFARGAANCLDGYEDAGVFGGPVRTVDYGDKPPIRLRTSGKVYASLRVQPHEKSAPVAIHLVDWSTHSAPFSVVLQPERFFGDRPLRVRLLTPAPYDKTLHAEAERTGQFRNLCRSTLLGEGRQTTFEIPALSPWGILLVEPAGGDSANAF